MRAVRGARRRRRCRPKQEPLLASEVLDTTGEVEPAKFRRRDHRSKGAAADNALSWQDIVVVPRKRFLKGGRAEFAPFAGMTVNDNLLRHYVFGLDFNYFLTDALWAGLQGQ
jgi:hypothetical protein